MSTSSHLDVEVDRRPYPGRTSREGGRHRKPDVMDLFDRAVPVGRLVGEATQVIPMAAPVDGLPLPYRAEGAALAALHSQSRTLRSVEPTRRSSRVLGTALQALRDRWTR